MKLSRSSGRPPHPQWHGAAIAGMAGLGLGEITAAAQGRSLVDALGRAVVDWSPRPLVDMTVDLLGSQDKTTIRISVGATIIGATIGLARLPARVRTPAVAELAAATAGLSLRRPPRSPLATVSAATVGAVATSLGLSRSTVSAPGTAALALLGAGSLAAARSMLAHQRRQHQEATDKHPGPSAQPDRSGPRLVAERVREPA